MSKELNLYKHNKKTYQKIHEAYSKGEKIVGIVQATGTGKSYNGLQLTLDNPDKKVIWLTPLNVIIEHIEDIIVKEGFSKDIDFNNLEFINYHKLAHMTDEDIEKLDCDLLIIDEFHHLGAPVWGDRINKLISSHKDINIFGMTAYTVRDRGTAYERDMANDNGNELFSNKIVSNYTLADAIVEDILPPPIYKTSVIEIVDKEVKELEEKINSGTFTYDEKREYEKYLRDVKNQVHKSTSIPDILKTNIRNDGKYIYFCPVNSIDDDNDIVTIKNKILDDLLKIGFKEENIVFYETTSYDEKNGKINRDAFANDLSIDGNDVSKKLRIMFAKNQYNEGTHIKGIDGVIFGRGTYSDIVFFEQMGRCLTVDKSNNILKRQLETLDENSLISLAKYRNLNIEKDITKEELVDLLARPTVIDLAGNYDFISNLKDEIKDKVKEKVSITKDPKELQRLYKIITNINIEIKDIDMLKTLQNLNNNVSNIQWDRMYELAKAYYNYHGSLDMPYKFVIDGYIEGKKVDLKLWIRMQIQAFRKGTLSGDRIKKLKSIGMSFEYKYSRLSWDEMYKLAKAYYNFHGSLNIPKTFKVDGYEEDKTTNLGIWIFAQKMLYRKGKLPKDKINKLKSIGIKFEKVQNTISWDEWYEFATLYYKEHGNLDVPARLIIEKDGNKINIGYWINEQRNNYKKGKLSKEQIEKLNCIGMIWTKITKAVRKLTWDEMYQLAKAYYEYHGNLNIPQTFKVEGYDEDKKTNLGQWVSEQRKNYNKGTLSKERIKKLESINMIWDARNNRGKYDDGFWLEMYKLAEAYYKYHGHLDIPQKFEVDGYNEEKITKLGSWISNQRIRYKAGNLSKEKINLLNGIGMIWEKKPGRSRK